MKCKKCKELLRDKNCFFCYISVIIKTILIFISVVVLLAILLSILYNEENVDNKLITYDIYETNNNVDNNKINNNLIDSTENIPTKNIKYFLSYINYKYQYPDINYFQNNNIFYLYCGDNWVDFVIPVNTKHYYDNSILVENIDDYQKNDNIYLDGVFLASNESVYNCIKDKNLLYISDINFINKFPVFINGGLHNKIISLQSVIYAEGFNITKLSENNDNKTSILEIDSENKVNYVIFEDSVTEKAYTRFIVRDFTLVGIIPPFSSSVIKINTICKYNYFSC
jgi:hypothetical protein